MDELLPPLSRRRAYRQMTSWSEARGRPGIYGEWLKKCEMLRSGVPLEIARASGPGAITRLFFTFPTFWRPSLFREVVLRIHWDGSPVPAVEAPIGDFFGIHFARYRPYASRFLSVTTGGLVCTAPMPFERGFSIVVEQQGRTPVPMFFWGVGFYELDAQETPLRFHARWRRDPLVAHGEPFTFVETEGHGHYVGLHLSTQNRDLWLRPPLVDWMLPRGWGLGHLEGWEEIFVDGACAHRGTGHEEYFNAGWYFRDGAAVSLDHGCLHRSYLSGRVAAYRYHYRDPLPFSRTLRGVLHHGMRDEVPADYAATAYWYQEGTSKTPHRLPPVEQRAVLPSLRARISR